jgi:hypothetical protein
MKTSLLLISLFTFAAAPTLRADQLEMQNGDRYVGKVLSMSADTVVLQSEVLGKINVPRKKVASILIGTNAPAHKPANVVPQISQPATSPVATPHTALASTNLDLSAALRNLGANTNFIQQIRQQMLSAESPEANDKYNELVNGLLTGQLNLNDIRAQAKSSAEQLRAYKEELGPEVGDSLDVYLKILEGFLSKTGSAPVPPSTNAPAVAKPKVDLR